MNMGKNGIVLKNFYELGKLSNVFSPELYSRSFIFDSDNRVIVKSYPTADGSDKTGKNHGF